MNKIKDLEKQLEEALNAQKADSPAQSAPTIALSPAQPAPDPLP